MSSGQPNAGKLGAVVNATSRKQIRRGGRSGSTHDRTNERRESASFISKSRKLPDIEVPKIGKRRCGVGPRWGGGWGVLGGGGGGLVGGGCVWGGWGGGKPRSASS